MPMFRDIKLHIKPEFCIYTAFILLLLPLNWVIGWMFAAVFHELCHCAVLAALRVKIYSISIGASGAEIETEHMMTHQEFLCSLAGPLGGLCLILFLRIFPELAIFALLQSVYNLLPIYPLDGGRALRCVAIRFAGFKKSVIISGGIEIAVFILLFILAGYAMVILKVGMVPLACVLLLLWKNKTIKFPCKPSEQIVQ